MIRVDELSYSTIVYTIGITVSTIRRDSFEILEPSKVSKKLEIRNSSGARIHIEMTLTKQDRF